MFACAMLSCLVVQPFLLAMPADICLTQNNCSETLNWVLLFCKVSTQYISLVKFSLKLPPFGDEVWALFCAMPSNKLGTLLGGAVKSLQRLPPSLLAALPFNIACKPILLSDPAHAVLRSACSAGEISEVLWSRHRCKSHRLT